MEIYDKLKDLKTLDTAAISDALDSLNINGGLTGRTPQTEKCNLVGQAYTIQYIEPTESEKKQKNAANFIDDIPEGYIPVLANNGRMDCTVWGDILTDVAIKNGIPGTVIDRLCRDIRHIRDCSYKMFSKGVFMQSGKGRTVMSASKVAVKIGVVHIKFGDYIRGDENGIVVIPQEHVDQVIQMAKIVVDKEKKIRNMIKKGERLDIARETFNYSHAWEDKDEIS